MQCSRVMASNERYSSFFTTILIPAFAILILFAQEAFSIEVPFAKALSTYPPPLLILATPFLPCLISTYHSLHLHID